MIINKEYLVLLIFQIFIASIKLILSNTLKTANWDFNRKHKKNVEIKNSWVWWHGSMCRTDLKRNGKSIF